jgi:XRE family transcriptional regulator, fatty acid utilization regulator
MDSKTDFGRRLRELRLAAGLTLEELGEKAGMHFQAIHRLERGERLPGWETLCGLADALSVPLDAFREKPEQKKGGRKK